MKNSLVSILLVVFSFQVHAQIKVNNLSWTVEVLSEEYEMEQITAKEFDDLMDGVTVDTLNTRLRLKDLVTKYHDINDEGPIQLDFDNGTTKYLKDEGDPFQENDPYKLFSYVGLLIETNQYWVMEEVFQAKYYLLFDKKDGKETRVKQTEVPCASTFSSTNWFERIGNPLMMYFEFNCDCLDENPMKEGYPYNTVAFEFFGTGDKHPEKYKLRTWEMKWEDMGRNASFLVRLDFTRDGKTYPVYWRITKIG